MELVIKEQEDKKLKILVVCQYYHPEPFRVTDTCESLVKLGHDVTVITGLPNYPMGEIYEGYKNKKNREEIINGVKVHRCYEIARKTGAIRRFLNYYSFVFSSTHYLKNSTEDFDMVFVYQLSPVMMANAGIAYKKKFKKKLVLYSLDLWPESLLAGGIKKGSMIYRYFHKVSNKIYGQVDKLMVSSKSFNHYFEKEFGIKDTIYLPQYAEDLFSPDMCYKRPGSTVNLMFAGNVGVAQSVETIVYAADKMRNRENLFWHIVGDGSELSNIKRLVEELGLENVFFHGRKPLEEMPEMYSKADAMLVTMKDDVIGTLTLPAKIQSYMAAGKPIIGSASGESMRVIGDAACGFCCNAGDVDGLVKCVESFMESDVRELAENSRHYYINNFTKEIYITKLLKTLGEE